MQQSLQLLQQRRLQLLQQSQVEEPEQLHVQTADVKKEDLQHQEACQQQHRQHMLVIEQHLQDAQQQLQQAQHETSDKRRASV